MRIKKANTVKEKKSDLQNNICHNVDPSNDLTKSPPKLKLRAPKKTKRGPKSVTNLNNDLFTKRY